MTDKPKEEYLKVPMSLAQDCVNYIMETPSPSMPAKISLQLVMGIRACVKVGAAEPTAPADLEKAPETPETFEEATQDSPE